MPNSVKLYNQFAKYYRVYSEEKQNYLSAIDELIIEALPQRPIRALDIGCGDGYRSYHLFRKTNINNLVMIDNSDEMIKLAKNYEKSDIEVLKTDITKSNQLSSLGKFDIILCLWNVLGHINTRKERLKALENIRSLMRDEAFVFLDVSNRYNAKYYGIKNLIKNIIKDLFRGNVNEIGDFEYQIKVDERKYLDAKCHFFSPFEIRNLIKSANLKITNELAINYETGKVEKNCLQGHLFYQLKKMKLVNRG